jgi:uncharacterized protein (DUF433 family)
MVMTVQPITHIQCDERGIAWIGETNTKVIEVAAEHVSYGWEAEEIHAAHPHLALAQIHAALSFYYDHKMELDQHMQRQMAAYQRLRSEAKAQITTAELRGRLARR